MQNKTFFYIFYYNLPACTWTSFLKIKFLLKFCVKILFCRHYFSLVNTFMRKGKDPGGPKTCGSCWSGSGSPTLDTVHLFWLNDDETDKEMANNETMNGRARA
jgi:hypothetical protein